MLFWNVNPDDQDMEQYKTFIVNRVRSVVANL